MEKELVTEANRAVSHIIEELRQTGPDGVTFVSIKKLCNGGFLFDLKSPEVVSWLCKPEVKHEWLKLFPSRQGAQGTARGNYYNTIARFVPTTFQVENEEMYREAEMLSELPDDAVEMARWIKPVERCLPGQKHTHLIISFAGPESANGAIAYGMTIEGKQIQLEKLAKEVKRCNRCMKLNVNHIARDCPSPHPICGKCVDKHTTDECICSEDTFKCPNCQQEGHTAFDRNCPKYIEENIKINDQTPENDYIFFVTEDPAMHVRYSDRYVPAPTFDSTTQQSEPIPSRQQPHHSLPPPPR